ncbi:MAG: aminotransferase class IV [Balneolales bacterium]|nr:aminotransferase class IV [Balneolales bacterium]
MEADKAHISAMDRGFLFGDGIYEVTRVVNGNPFRLDDHLARMDHGLQALGIELSPDERARIPQLHLDLLEKNKLTEGQATIYLQVSRGTAFPRTHAFPDPAVKPTLFMTAAPFKPFTELHAKGITAITISDVRWSRCNLKTVNLLPNVLATNEAKKAGVGTALMVRDGVITESPNANVFGVIDGVLYTYPVSHYILNGITRMTVVEMARDLGIPLCEVAVRDTDLSRLSELFVSGTTTDVQPIVTLDGAPVGDGKRGPVAKALQDELLKRFEQGH